MKKTNHLRRLALAGFAALALMLCAAPQAQADDATTLASYIYTFNHGGTGTLSASTVNNIVTVTGTGTETVTGATNTLALNIDPGVTVVWQADYAGAAALDKVITIEGSGTFKVDAGGKVETTSITQHHAAVWVTQGTVEVSDSGTVLASDENGEASGIRLEGSGPAYATAKISGGTVETKSYHHNSAAVYVTCGTVEVSSGTIVASNASAGSRSTALWLTGTYTTDAIAKISGGKVETASRESGYAVQVMGGGTVEVSGNGEVIASHASGEARAIWLNGYYNTADATAKISGGTVETKSNDMDSAAVYVQKGTVEVSGTGTVLASDTSGQASAIRLNGDSAATDAMVEIKGGTVQTLSNSPGSAAVFVSRGNVEVSGGKVLALSGVAPTVRGAINLTGGVVMGRGSTQAEVVKDGGSFAITGPTSNAIVIAWANPGAASYTHGSNTDLTVFSEGNSGTATWQANPSGVKYTNGSNTGFIPMPAVTVVSSPPSGNSGGSGSGGVSSKITSKAGTGGKITAGSLTSDGKQTFTITPSEGYEIDDVLVDGESVGALKTYTFTDAGKTAHTIEAKFKKIAELPQPVPPTYQPMAPLHSPGTQVEAVKTNNPLLLSGQLTQFPAIKIGGYNWLKLRDFAMLLSGTSKQFAISYNADSGIIDIFTGQAYQPLGSELTDMLAETESATASLQQLRVNGEFIDIAAYNTQGYNYLRLRDLAIILDFAVIYDEASGQITLDFANPYSE